ncbi:transmembrane anchor protein [Hydrogenophaga sp. R2]|uniref:transmembrane anchor protein n=1 Tax=Hydrogenophaga sp. R2 TaxID=3132827 RepID=UPI003CF4D9FE
MYNSDIPSRAELPSTRQLIRSTIIAAVSAVVLLYTVVLPSEYGVDPTGIGRALGLTEMGEIKTRLAQEAAEDEAATKAANAAPAAGGAPSPAAVTPPAAAVAASAIPAAASTASAPAAASPWRDEMTFTLTPGQGTEIKMKMKEGEKALFAWTVQGGVVNFDTHGDALGKSISYEKGRAVASDDGELVAAFTGNHGWFWRNRGQADVTVVLKTGGEYGGIQKMK